MLSVDMSALCADMLQTDQLIMLSISHVCSVFWRFEKVLEYLRASHFPFMGAYTVMP